MLNKDAFPVQGLNATLRDLQQAKARHSIFKPKHKQDVEPRQPARRAPQARDAAYTCKASARQLLFSQQEAACSSSGGNRQSGVQGGIHPTRSVSSSLDHKHQVQ
jgi:hypothetical protein